MTKPREAQFKRSDDAVAFAVEGMDLRDYLAAQALKVCNDFTRPELVAGRAYAIADAMLVERAKE